MGPTPSSFIIYWLDLDLKVNNFLTIFPQYIARSGSLFRASSIVQDYRRASHLPPESNNFIVTQVHTFKAIGAKKDNLTLFKSQYKIVCMV